MIAKMAPHPDQLRWYLQSALNGFDTLAHDAAILNARDEIAAFISYLNRTDNSVPVTGIKPIEARVWHERSVSDDNIANVV